LPNRVSLQRAGDVVLGVAYYGQRKFVKPLQPFSKLENRPMSAASGLPEPLSEHWNDRKGEGAVVPNLRETVHSASFLKVKGDAALLRRAAQLNPQMGDAHFELGSVLEAQRDFAGAIESFRKAALLAPKNPAPHYRLSRLYARTGDRVKADQERALHEKLSAEEKAELDGGKRRPSTSRLEAIK
jgi:tetratricopeptide (TPR) repeat protein